MLNSAARQALGILGWQLLSMILLTAGAGWLFDSRTARSALVGACIGWIATAYLAFVLIKHDLQPTRPATLLSLFGNWFVKTALVLGLLAIALRSKQLLPAAVMTGLATSLVIYWLSVVTKRVA